MDLWNHQFSKKWLWKIWRISALCTIKTLRAEILQIFWVIFWKSMISQIHSDLIWPLVAFFPAVTRFEIATYISRHFLTKVTTNFILFAFFILVENDIGWIKTCLNMLTFYLIDSISNFPTLMRVYLKKIKCIISENAMQKII